MKKIFCPTDFTVASHAAFQHALSLTLAHKGNLIIMHVPTDADDKHGFPGVRDQLTKWCLLGEGSSKETLSHLGIDVEKVVGRTGDPVDIVLHYLDHKPVDLVVLSTHQREGRSRWLGRAIAEPLARGSHAMTLFLPQGLGGFVSPKDGSLNLKRILIPISRHPSPQPAVTAAIQLLSTCGVSGATITLLYVGDAPDMPAVDTTTHYTVLGMTQEIRSGEPVEKILEVAEEIDADLVVMSTAGHHGFLDALRGSTTERVLRKLSCPLLAVPINKKEES